MSIKSLVIYDSQFGNTRQIAEIIASTLTGTVTLASVREIEISQLEGYDLLVVGTPTQGGLATQPIRSFLSQLSVREYPNLKVACFDTRLLKEDVGFGLKLVLSLIGYASPRMVSELSQKGVSVIAEPEGFAVKDKEGPLKEGEVQRAKDWAVKLTALVLQ